MLYSYTYLVSYYFQPLELLRGIWYVLTFVSQGRHLSDAPTLEVDPGTVLCSGFPSSTAHISV